MDCSMRAAIVAFVVMTAVVVGAAEPKRLVERDTTTAEASRRYDAGMRLYNISDFAAALEEFRRAYLVKADPAFLFNIAQCQRQMSRYDEAAKTYRAFLREAQGIGDAQRDQVKALVAQMEQAARDAQARAAQPPTGTTPPGGAPAPEEHTVASGPPPAPSPAPQPAPPAPPERARTPLYKKWWLWTTVGIVAAGAVGVSVGVGVAASRSSTWQNGPTVGLGANGLTAEVRW